MEENGKKSRSRVERRTFLTTGLAAAAGYTSLEAAASPVNEDVDASNARSPEGIPLRKFGKSGATLPILGMGGSAMVGRFITGYGARLLPLEERVKMARYAFDRGVRYFDTARIYGESESIFGKALHDVRDMCFIASKWHTTNPTSVRESVETSLEQLRTDHVDLLQIHSPAIEAVGFKKAMSLHAEIVKLRDEGLCKYIGLTTHVAFETIYEMIATGGFDAVLLAHGYFRKGLNTILSNRNIEYREQCLNKAEELRMGIIAMKVFGASILSHNSNRVVPEFDDEKRKRLAGASIRWVLKDRRVSMLNIGVSLPSDIDENLATIRGNTQFTADDGLLLAEFAGKAYESDQVKKMRVT